MTPASVAAQALRLYCAPRAARFSEALADVAGAQRRALRRILRECAPTEYGRSLGLAQAMDADDYRARVPVSDYERLSPWIERQRAQGGDVIARGVRTWEPTSGSSGAAKHIPYNAALLGAFRSLFAVWAHDLLASVLRPRSGRTFMSVSSPVAGAEGFADDREYLGPLARALVGRFLVMPPRLAAGASAEAWRDALASALLAHPDLEVVSVWNPSYFLILLEHLEQRQGRRDWQALWPRLQLISCWRDAAAAAPAARLAALFPRARLQGKGLLATEAPVSVPLEAAGGCLPLVDEVFLEMEDEAGKPRLLHELETGKEYEVLVSQAGGLLRYRLGDRVRATGFYRGAPCLAFVGRAGGVVDLVGEKLNEAFVAQVLGELAQAGAFCTLVPVQPEHGARPYYRLLTDDPRPGLEQELDAALMRAFRYREARSLGQLDALRATRRPDMRRAVHDALVAGGMKAGDVKDRALLASPELARRVQRALA